jgi:N utilization substance protein A
MAQKNFSVVGNREIVIVAETIAQQKGIPTDVVIKAMEEGIKLAARKKYGHDLLIKCSIDKKTGKISIYNKVEIVENKFEKNEEFDVKHHITLSDAKKELKSNQYASLEKEDDELVVGSFIKYELPPIDLNRVVAQIAKNEIVKKVREAEKEKEYNEFVDRKGEIINGVVKKIGLRNLVVEVEGYETIINEEDLIGREIFRVGDRIRAYIVDVRKEMKGAQIFLSRTHPQFVAKLFAQEVPEIYDGVIEIKAIARDPGSRAKVAVFSREETADVIGACIGVRGSRVQAVMSEIRGEKIDIIKWSDNLAEFIVNALIPAKITKVVVDEDNDLVEVVVPEDQLSLTIGRGGQNVKLASQLINMKIDVITEAEEQERRRAEFNTASKLFVEGLDVEEVIAQLLVAEGFFRIEDIAEAEIEELKNIEGFDEDIAKEIRNRALEYLEDNSEEVVYDSDESVESNEEVEVEPVK